MHHAHNAYFRIYPTSSLMIIIFNYFFPILTLLIIQLQESCKRKETKASPQRRKREFWSNLAHDTLAATISRNHWFRSLKHFQLMVSNILTCLSRTWMTTTVVVEDEAVVKWKFTLVEFLYENNRKRCKGTKNIRSLKNCIIYPLILMLFIINLRIFYCYMLYPILCCFSFS